MDWDHTNSVKMWMIDFREPKSLLEFWYSIHWKFGWAWDQLRQQLGRSPCQLFMRGNGYVAVLTVPSGAVPESVSGLLALCGAQRIDRHPDGLMVANLSECLMGLKLKRRQAIEIPQFAIFALQHRSGANDFVRWLMAFRYGDLRFAVEEAHGRPSVWLIAAERLGSWTPFMSHFRDQQLPGTRVFIPIDERSSLACPQGFYTELGHAPQVGDAFKELWADYGGAYQQHLVLRGVQDLIHVVDSIRFAPIPDVAELVLDTNLTRMDFRPARASGQLGPIELRIEPKPFHERLHPRLKWRRLKDQIDYLNAEAERLELEDSEDTPEPLVLIRIPQHRECALREVLRRTPEEILWNFVYFSRDLDGQRCHFIYPATTAVHRTFPEVPGASYLYCQEEWHRRGLHLFMAPNLRLELHLHFSNAPKLRQVLLNGTAVNGLGDSPLFVFWPDEQERIRQCILPDPRIGFIPLLQALKYINGCLLTDIKTELLSDTVDNFCEVFNQHLEQGKSALQDERREFHKAVDTFFTTASRRMNQVLSKLKEIQSHIINSDGEIQKYDTTLKNLEKEKQQKMAKINEIHAIIRNTPAKDRQNWDVIKRDLESLQKAIEDLLNER